MSELSLYNVDSTTSSIIFHNLKANQGNENKIPFGSIHIVIRDEVQLESLGINGFNSFDLKEYHEEVDCPFTKYLKDLKQLLGETSEKDISETAIYSKRQQLIEDIVSFRSLINSWDGYGAIPAEIKSVSNAIEILTWLEDDKFESINDVYPNTNGTITIDWETNLGSLSLEVGNEVFSYYERIISEPEPAMNDNLKISKESIRKLAADIKRL